MNKVTDEIAEKIRKCLALAHGLNATPGEMEVAMAKAKEIAMRHGIDLASIHLSDPKKSALRMDIQNDKSLKIRTEYEQPYHTWIFSVLKEVFGVQFLTSRGRGKNRSNVILHAIHALGESADLVIVKELFPWLEGVFWETFYRGAKAGKYQKNAAGRNGCYAGLYHGIVEANKREEAKLSNEDRSKWALVVRSKADQIAEFKAQQFPDSKARTSKSLKMDNNAYQHGYIKGKTVNLNRTGDSAAAPQLS